MYFHTPTLINALRHAFSPRNLSWAHLFFSISFPILFLMLRGVIWCARQLDKILYPAYRKQPVKAPIFIIGNPRSGTTFTHRLISADPMFTHFQLTHTIFPAVVFYKLFSWFGKMDRRLGRPLGRLMQRASDKGLEGWKEVHKTGPQEAESDEMLFVYCMLSPLIGLLFPYFDALPHIRAIDTLPETQRRKIAAYFLDCLKRHLYATGPDKILLEKVALIAGRLQTVLDALPDMRLVHLIRHPYESVPSLISMFAIPWKTLAPKAAQRPETHRALARMIFDYYRYILEIKKTLPPEQYLEIYYEDLVANPGLAVERIYSHFGLPLSPGHQTYLEAQTQRALKYKSNHNYSLDEFGLSKELIYAELKEVFEAYGFKP
jgi:hypothetical protein